MARYLIERFTLLKMPYFLVEEDVRKAAEYHGDGVSVIAGNVASPALWEDVRVSEAHGVVVNSNDARNTNIILTVRQESSDVPLVACADNLDSIDILELAGATRVLPIKDQLGQALASRVNAGHAEAHVVGEFRGLTIAEFAVHNTPLVNKSLGDSKIQQEMGAHIVGVWERGRLHSPRPDLILSESSVALVIGSNEQITALNEFLVIYSTNYNPTIIIGGGVVGRAAAAALKRRGLTAHIVERDERVVKRIGSSTEQFVVGDAADGEVLRRAGLGDASAVIISTNDDSTNVYLSIYCRRLNPKLRIISRSTHDRNLEALHRAGSDFVISYSSLGAESIISFLRDRELMMLGAGMEMFHLPVPSKIDGASLGDAEIGTRTGLIVIAVISGEDIIINPATSQHLPPKAELLMIGTSQQRNEFKRLFC